MRIVYILFTFLFVSCAASPGTVRNNLTERQIEYCNGVAKNLHEMNKSLSKLMYLRSFIAQREPAHSPNLINIDEMIQSVADDVEEVETEFLSKCFKEG